MPIVKLVYIFKIYGFEFGQKVDETDYRCTHIHLRSGIQTETCTSKCTVLHPLTALVDSLYALKVHLTCCPDFSHAPNSRHFFSFVVSSHVKQSSRQHFLLCVRNPRTRVGKIYFSPLIPHMYYLIYTLFHDSSSKQKSRSFFFFYLQLRTAI